MLCVSTSLARQFDMKLGWISFVLISQQKGLRSIQLYYCGPATDNLLVSLQGEVDTSKMDDNEGASESKEVEGCTGREEQEGPQTTGQTAPVFNETQTAANAEHLQRMQVAKIHFKFIFAALAWKNCLFVWVKMQHLHIWRVCVESLGFLCDFF